MQANELRELSLEELQTKLADLKEEYFNLKFQHATGQLESPMRLPQTRKDIARVRTVLGELEEARD
jgi:large subunit ribosomal protein L29